VPRGRAPHQASAASSSCPRGTHTRTSAGHSASFRAARSTKLPRWPDRSR